MRTLVFTVAMAIAITRVDAAASPPIHLGVPLSERDLKDIGALVGPDQPIWLIHAIDGCAPSFCTVANVFFYPDRTTSAVRRGRGTLLQRDLSSPEERAGWKVIERTINWAEVGVADGHSPTQADYQTSLWTPFAVEGQISDSDLVDVVHLAQSISERGRIMAVKVQGDGRVEAVVLGGVVILMERRGQKWEVLKSFGVLS